MTETLAEHVHNIWMKWAKTIMDREPISEETKERWNKCMVPYSELTHEMKEADRDVVNALAKDFFETLYNSDPYFNTQRCIDRLYEQYQLHGQLIVGFDFDDTVFDFHNKGFKYIRVIDILKKCGIMGFPLVMISCKEKQEELEHNAQVCRKLGIPVDYVNCSPIMRKASKPFVNILLDDKAGLKQAYEILNATINKIVSKEK